MDILVTHSSLPKGFHVDGIGASASTVNSTPQRQAEKARSLSSALWKWACLLPHIPTANSNPFQKCIFNHLNLGLYFFYIRYQFLLTIFGADKRTIIASGGANGNIDKYVAIGGILFINPLWLNTHSSINSAFWGETL